MGHRRLYRRTRHACCASSPAAAPAWIGFAVLYPAQCSSANRTKCWNWYVACNQTRGLGEAALIADMTRATVAAHALDGDRVDVAGLSAGGAMAAILAAEYPDLYAALGVHSGVRPGDADVTVHPLNAVGVIDAVPGELARTAVTTRVDAERNHRAYTHTVYRQGDARLGPRPTRAESWIVHGGEHAWSGGDASGSHVDAAGPDASREMLRFFLEHPLAQRT